LRFFAIFTDEIDLKPGIAYSGTMSKSDTLQALKQQMQAYLSPSSIETLACSRLSLGVPRGALIELSGPSRTEWLLQFLKEHPELQVCWLEKKFTLLPTAVEQQSGNLERFLFVETGDDLFTPVRKALRSHVFDVLVFPNDFVHERALKSLQLLTEKAHATCFLLAPQASTAWPISVQLRCEGPDQTQVLKHKKAAHEKN
jgi:hypothetical protein